MRTRSPRIEIRTFPSDADIIYGLSDRSDLDIKPDESGRFIRSIAVIPPRFCFWSLEKLLAKAETEFQRLASMTGARVVPHKWGWIRPDNNIYKVSNYRTGRAFYMASEVDYIQKVEDVPARISSKLADGVSAYTNGLYAGAKLKDIFVDQFLYGVNTAEGLDRPELFLVDIEPRYQEQVI